MIKQKDLANRFAVILEERSGLFVLAIGIITLLLILPLVLLSPTQRASESPGGTVYDLEESYNSNLPPRVHNAFFIAESKNGDILTKAPLLEILENTERLREADTLGLLNPPGLAAQTYLHSTMDINSQQQVKGIFTIADAVAEVLKSQPVFGISLKEATDEQVKLALHYIFSDTRTKYLSYSLSQLKKVEQKNLFGQKIDFWYSPAILIGLSADNEKLGGGSFRIGATADPVTTVKEQFNRNVQTILRGKQENYNLWGVAIDAGLEIDDEVGTSVPYIVATFIMVLIVVGIALKSLKMVFLTAGGLITMMVWFKGLSNLVGLKSSTTLDFIVPIAMISLGADFVIHSVNRYKEERSQGIEPKYAFRLGMGGVIGALTLAMITDAIAFVSNVSANIEAVVGFGIGAGLAIFSAFIVMGITVPVILMRLERWNLSRPKIINKLPRARIFMLVGPDSFFVPNIVMFFVRWRMIVLGSVAVITALSGYYALKLDATFDVKDFYRSESDFAIGLDKMDIHVGQTGGESAVIYIEGDVSNPNVLVALSDLIVTLRKNRYVGVNDLGDIAIQNTTLFELIYQTLNSDYAMTQIRKQSGLEFDPNKFMKFKYGDKIFSWPNSSDQLSAIYDFITVNGVPISIEQHIYDRLEVGETLYIGEGIGKNTATVIEVGIPGTREQAKVIASRKAIEKDIEVIRSVHGIYLVGLTGSAYTRQAALDATTEGLQKAFGIAIILCMIVSIIAMQSFRLGIVTIVPIILVVFWLYGFMYAFGFGLNFVTATIAAVSIGVGVDYAIHMTQRFREEMGRLNSAEEALKKSAGGTGIALIYSAVTSILGFSIMAFAPMPMFAAYGFLTATMIFLALIASLLVLPPLLLLVTPVKTQGRR